MKVRYRVGWRNPSSHLFDVRMRVEGIEQASLNLAMPAWVPGSYEIRNSARHVQELEAWSGKGRLPTRRIDKQTWQVDTRGVRAIELRYRVYGNTVDDTASSLDSTHAHITGATVFLYLVGRTDLPCEVELDCPKGWRIATGLERARRPRLYRAADYDTLIDCPIEISNFEEISFRVGGRRHHLVLHRYGKEKKNGPRLAKDCAKFIRTYQRLFGGAPYREYWFLCHFHPTIAKGGGLEHHNSTHISLPQFLDSEEEKDYDRVLEFAAHEFFHLWNVKRLRPEGLGPFDYAREVYTPNLWVAEGITEYYGGYGLRRSRVWNREKYLEGLAFLIDRLRDMPGERIMSLREASLATWTNAPWHRLRAPDDTNLLNSYVDYYTKGALLAWLLDLQIRIETQGRRSLDQVMRLLWRRFGKENRPYPEKAVEEAVGRVAGPTVRRWLAREFSRSGPLRFDSVLRRAGLRLRFLPQTKKEEGEKTRRKIDAATGIEIQTQGEAVRIANVLPESRAESSGIEKGDHLLAIDGEKAVASNWRELLKGKPGKRTVELFVFRHGRLLRFAVSPRREVRRYAQISVDPKASRAAKRIAQSWLGR